MPILNPITIKLMAILLGGSLVLTPIHTPQAGKITNKIENTIIDKAREKRKQIDDPNYIPKKKPPITAGYKPGANPLPETITPAQNYQNIWTLLKKELGL